MVAQIPPRLQACPSFSAASTVTTTTGASNTIPLRQLENDASSPTRLALGYAVTPIFVPQTPNAAAIALTAPLLQQAATIATLAEELVRYVLIATVPQAPLALCNLAPALPSRPDAPPKSAASKVDHIANGRSPELENMRKERDECLITLIGERAPEAGVRAGSLIHPRA